MRTDRADAHRSRPDSPPFGLEPGGPWPVLGPRDAHVWRFDLDAPSPSARMLGSALSPDERDRAGRFVYAKDGARHRLAHSLLRGLLARYTARAPGELSFIVSAGGKPELSPNAEASGLHFNLSHSGRFAIVGVATCGRIGVDIEAHRPMPDLDDIAERHFAPAERARLQALPASQREAAFFACWTRKEAFVKAIGTGLATPLDRFEVTLGPGEPAVLRSIEGSADAARGWTLLDLDSGDATTAAIAVEAPGVVVHRFRLREEHH